MLATAVQAQQNSNVQLTRRSANAQQSVEQRTPLAVARPAALPFTPKAATVVNAFPWYDGFEHGMGNWTLIDADGDGYNFEPMAYEGARHGNNVCYGYSYYASGWFGSPLTPDNWMVSPKMNVPENSNLRLTWSHMTIDPDYPAEHYSVYIATGNTVADFTARPDNLKYTYTFTAYEDPYWQNDTATTKALTQGSTGSDSITMPGSAESFADVSIQNKSGDTLNTLTVSINGHEMSFTNLNLANNGTLAIDHVLTNGVYVLQAKIGTSSVLQYRTGDDDFITKPGANAITYTAEGAVLVTVSAKGRYL